MTNIELWQTVLAQIELSNEISRANFVTWFKNTSVISCGEEKITIAVHNTFAKEWLENKYNKFILKYIRSVEPSIKKVEYIIQTTPTTQEKTSLGLKKFVPILTINEEGSRFKEIVINKETNLNPKYTLENFVVGGFNELAYAAAQAISKTPGVVYNPLFIYGGVGVGKTHLLQAIGNRIVKTFSNIKLLYVPSEKFTEEVVNSIGNHTIEEMKNRYHSIDFLILDDIQFIAGKDKTQEELFHIFNTLYHKNKQIIFSSDRPPKTIPAIEERLRSRFEGGMIADIGVPDLETRIAILKTKLAEQKNFLPDFAVDFIATHIQKNIRELEGALTRVLGYTNIYKKNLSPQTLEQILKNLIIPPKKMVTTRKIIETVAEFYDIQSKDLISANRKKQVVHPRQIAMYLLREELQSSYPYIGDLFGGKDHTTVIHAYEKVVKELNTNENLYKEIQLIKQRLYTFV